MPTCPQCPGRHFKNDAALQAHSKALKHGSHTCVKCSHGFSSQQGLEQHTLDKHPSFECHYCDRKFTTEKGRSAHEQTKHAPTFECEYCDREFATDEGRLAHQKVKHPTFACDLCDLEFSSEEALEQHEEAKHPTYECRYCDTEFASEDARDAHEEDEHPTFECNFCDQEFISENARQQHEDTSHKCRYCDRLFANDEARLQHANAKHRTQRVATWWIPHIQCGYCSSKFSTQNAKEQHERSCDSNPANHVKRSTSVSSDQPRLRTGVVLADEPVGEESTDDEEERTTSPSRSSHSTIDEEMFHSPSQALSTDAIGDESCVTSSDTCLCFLCSPRRQTSLSSNADKFVPDDAENIVSDCHSTSHRDTSFQCTPCLTLFETEEALRDHVCPSRTAMVRPYCFLCFGQFENQPSLQRHLETLLICQFCAARHCSAEALQSHLLTHPTCGKCDKSFADNVSLSMHVASDHPVVVCWDCDGAVVELHNLELHYKDSPAHATCSMCGLGQKNVAELDEHVKREHATAAIEADTRRDDVIVDPGCEAPSPGEDRDTISLERLDRTPTPSVVGSGLGPGDEQETLHVEPIDAPPPPAPSEAEHVPEAIADVREYAPSPTPSEHGSDTSRLHSPATHQTICGGTGPSSSVTSETIYNGTSPGSSASSASFSESATSDENSIVYVSADGIPEYVRENRAVLVATSARGRPLRLPSESSLESLDMSAEERATTSGTYRLHCRICLRDPCEDMTATICGHLFCKRCITQAVVSKSECPVCQSATLLYCLFKLDLSA